MSGGMRRGPAGIPIGQRTPAPTESIAERTRAAARHCWVVDPPNHPGIWAGLLIEWRTTPNGWQGRTLYAIPAPEVRCPTLIETWLDADRLQPVENDRPPI